MKVGVAAAILVERKNILNTKDLQVKQNAITSIERHLGLNLSGDYPNARLAEIIKNWISRAEGRYPVPGILPELVDFGLNN